MAHPNKVRVEKIPSRRKVFFCDIEDMSPKKALLELKRIMKEKRKYN